MNNFRLCFDFFRIALSLFLRMALSCFQSLLSVLRKLSPGTLSRPLAFNHAQNFVLMLMRAMLTATDSSPGTPTLSTLIQPRALVVRDQQCFCISGIFKAGAIYLGGVLSRASAICCSTKIGGWVGKSTQRVEFL